MDEKTMVAKVEFREQAQTSFSRLELCLRRRLIGKFKSLKSSHYDFDDVLASARRRRSARVFSDVNSNQDAASIVPALCMLDAESGATRLDAAIDLLQPTDRLMLELWLRGLSHEQIAVEMDVAIGAHRSRWQRLRARLRCDLAG